MSTSQRGRWNDPYDRYVELPLTCQLAVATRDVALVSLTVTLWTRIMGWDALSSLVAVAVAAGFVAASRACWLAGVPVFVPGAGPGIQHRRLASVLSWVLGGVLIVVALVLGFTRESDLLT